MNCPDKLSLIEQAASPRPWEATIVQTEDGFCASGPIRPDPIQAADDSLLLEHMRDLLPELMELWRAADRVSIPAVPPSGFNALLDARNLLNDRARQVLR